MLLIALECAAKIQSDAKILIISVPKSGTHLLGKVISLITGQQHKTPGLYGKRIEWVIKPLIHLNNAGKFSHVHTAYSNTGIEILRKNKVTSFFIYRDPRDQIISWMHHGNAIVMNADQQIKYALNPSILYMFATSGVSGLYETRMPWAHNKNICAIRFEDLIGSKGNGSDEKQHETIQRIAHHLGITLTEAEIASIVGQLFGGTATFHEGKIGSWRDYFTHEHKELCKKYIGSLLIHLKYEKSLDW